MNRSPYRSVNRECAAAVSSGECIQRLRIPLATVNELVASRRRSMASKRSPPTSGIQIAE